jgi:hypothetical protein
MTEGGGPRDRRSPSVPSFGPVVAAFVVSVTVFSVAAALALDGVPNTENGLFYAMGEVAGLDLAGVVVVSDVWLWIARLGGVVALASLVGVFVVRKRLGQAKNSA